MLRKRSVTLELRLRAQVEAQKETQQKLKMIAIRFLVGFSAVLLLCILVATDVLARESRIEEVHAKQLEKLLMTKHFVAVFWYSRGSRACDKALEALEDIDDDAQRFSIDFVKINDKRLAKSYGIVRFPSLSFFQDGKLHVFDGDINDEEDVLDFLTSDRMLIIPDKIENVNAETLNTIVEQEKYVTALFYDESKESLKILDELEKIDDEADVFKIRFVKINDQHLAEEYSLGKLPSLVYFRNKIPVVYAAGDLGEEDEVLEWLIQHQTSADEHDVVERVTKLELDIMIANVDHLLVFFHDSKKKSKSALESLEHIDDDCDRIGVSFVEVDDIKTARDHGVDKFPTLVYFENEIPAVYEGNMADNDQVMSWLSEQVDGSDIEEVRVDMLEKFVTKEDKLAVLFYDFKHEKSNKIIQLLEDIDDDLDGHNVLLIKIRDRRAAEDFGIEKRPTLVLFQKGVPNLYSGKLDDAQMVLEWILNEVYGDHKVEVVTDAMLEKLIENREHVAVLFYDKTDEKSQKVLDGLDQIDDYIHQMEQVSLVKLDDRSKARAYGIDDLPALVMFENNVPNLFQGDLLEPDVVLKWIAEITKEDHIEEINPKLLDKLLEEDKEQLVVYIYYKDIIHDVRLLDYLENIDSEFEHLDIHLVKLADDGHFADQHGVEIVPSLVIFKEGRTVVYKGDLSSENKVTEWIKKVLGNK